MHRRVRGFTLIELMIVVAAIAILAAIALPSFQEQARKSRRSEALSQLGQLQLAMERWRADCPTYAASSTCSGTYPAATMPTSQYYTFSIAGADATTYTLTATRSGSQTGDRCGNATATPIQKPTWPTADCN